MEMRIFDSPEPLTTVEGLFWSRYQKPSPTGEDSRIFHMLYKGENPLGGKPVNTGFGLLVTPQAWISRIPKSGWWRIPNYPSFKKIPKSTVQKALTDLMTNYLLFDFYSKDSAYWRAEKLSSGQFCLDIFDGLNGHNIIRVFGAKCPDSRSLHEHWGVVMDWDPKTKTANGFSHLHDNWDWEKESIQVDKPEDVAHWALTMLRMDGLI